MACATFDNRRQHLLVGVSVKRRCALNGMGAFCSTASGAARQRATPPCCHLNIWSPAALPRFAATRTYLCSSSCLTGTRLVYDHSAAATWWLPTSTCCGHGERERQPPAVKHTSPWNCLSGVWRTTWCDFLLLAAAGTLPSPFLSDNGDIPRVAERRA